MLNFYIGVDVGTGSVRSALVNADGHIIAIATKDIQIWSPKPGYYQQSSADIWNAVTFTIKEIITKAGIQTDQVKGIGFDATCSLVVLDKEGQPLTVSPNGDINNDIIMWMDHRAADQANRINETNHKVLQFTGGKISLEMQPPKLLWLKENLPDTWNKVGHFFDLPDFLTWKATGSFSRSLCSLVCKWTYQSDGKGSDGWSDSFWKAFGLDDLTHDQYSKIGNNVKPPGAPCGAGLTDQAAKDLGLVPGIPVGTSQIDAYAGGIGCLGCKPSESEFVLPDMAARIALICGTSTCHMQISKDPIFVPGVWGPYHSSMIPGLWNNEGGQSATGKLIDCVVETHPAYKEAQLMAKQRSLHVHELLNSLIEEFYVADKLTSLSELTQNFHIWPDFHGNRSPLADPSLKGMKCGMSLDCDIKDLAVQYLATIQALAYGTRHIIEEMKKSGHCIDVMFICGGLRKNLLYVQSHVDVTGLPMILPNEVESVLLGSAILGASASGDFPGIQEAMKMMGGTGRVVVPNMEEKKYHDKKYRVFLKMVEHQKEYKQIMDT